MDEGLKELIAVGASAAVNCHPCLEYHCRECERLGVPRADMIAAAEVGMTVNRGAAVKTRSFVEAVLGGARERAGDENGCGCGR